MNYLKYLTLFFWIFLSLILINHSLLNAETLFEREKSLNLTLENDFALINTNGSTNPQLNFNIGNTLYQLGEYPWAILYYYKALHLAPNDYQIKSQLRLAQDKSRSSHQFRNSILYLFFP